ncbi:MAG: DUF1573 domain-containing protein [Saprospiraceae bacterium]|nr:DUF1573 domain-containing protein [Saprospiraceae bacterium]
MQAPLRFLVWLFFIGLVGAVSAQPESIRPTLREMTTSQKMQMLDYLRSAGANLDREIQSMYEQLSPEKQIRAVQYLDLLNRGLETIPRTTVSWNRDTIRYGQVEDGAIVLDSFRVTNTGIYPYIIKDVRTSCDCTILQFPRYPVMPGESATIRLEFDSQGKLGRTTPGMVIYDNSSPNARTIVYLDGAVLPREKKKNFIKD